MISRDPPHPGSDASPGVLVFRRIRHIPAPCIPGSFSVSQDPPHPGSDASPGVLVLCGIRHIRLLSWNFEYHRADTAMAIGLCIMGQTKNTISISRLSFNKPPDTDETFGERYGISTYLSTMLQTLYLVAVQRVRRLHWKITCNTCHIPQLTSMNFRPDLKILVEFSVCLLCK